MYRCGRGTRPDAPPSCGRPLGRLQARGKRTGRGSAAPPVEVEVDERVVDVGAFSKESREHKATGGHVAVVLVEDVEEGHAGARSPGDDKTQADAEKHLREEVRRKRKSL